MKKTIITATAAILMAFGSGLTASADDIQKVEKHDGTTYTYDECVSIIFDKAWGSTYDDGVTFPQESFLYHRIRNFLDESYMSEENDHYRGSWDRKGDIENKWKLYNTDYWSEISSKDDNWNYTIVDKDDNLLYTFELVDGKWQQLDTSGNVVDTFDPHPVGTRPKGDIEYSDENHNLFVIHEDGSTEIIAEEDVDEYYDRQSEEDDEEEYSEENEDDSTAAVTGAVDEKLAKTPEPNDESKSGSGGGSRVHSDVGGSDDSGAGTAGQSAAVQDSENDEKEKGTVSSSKSKYIAIGATAAVTGVAAAICSAVKKKRK